MNRQYKRTGMILLAVLLLAAALSSCVGLPFLGERRASYTVTFDLNGGTLVEGELEQRVREGAAAVAPSAENGDAELSWDQDFSNVTSDLTVTAQWGKRELSATEVAEVVQKSTVTINCTFYNESTGSGSGFFIDDNGTIVTSYHVIEYATAISVEMPDGGSYEVSEVVGFNELNDLAILRINLPGSPALAISDAEVKVGETVYANGSALGILEGTFTNGTVSSVSRLVSGISCIQTNAAISSGNSGGPLVNTRAEVVGVNALSYVDGENLNMAVRIENLEDVAEVNYSVNEYAEWIMRETDRSYSPYKTEDNFFYSTINTYSYVTGRDCLYSIDFDDSIYDGYIDMCMVYVYDYVESESDGYVEYLKTKGFEFDVREEFSDGVSYYYVNDWSGITVDMFQSDDGDLYIGVFFSY